MGYDGKCLSYQYLGEAESEKLQVRGKHGQLNPDHVPKNKRKTGGRRLGCVWLNGRMLAWHAGGSGFDPQYSKKKLNKSITHQAH